MGRAGGGSERVCQKYIPVIFLVCYPASTSLQPSTPAFLFLFCQKITVTHLPTLLLRDIFSIKGVVDNLGTVILEEHDRKNYVGDI